MNETEKRIKKMGFMDAFSALEEPSKLKRQIRALPLPQTWVKCLSDLAGIRVVRSGTRNPWPDTPPVYPEQTKSRQAA